MVAPNYTQISCKVCNQTGAIKKAKIRRMSGPAVVIGYLFLIPSAFGMVLGLLALFASGSAGSEVAAGNQQEYAGEVERLGLTEAQVTQVLALKNPTGARLDEAGLTAEQVREVEALHRARTAGDAGAGAGAALGIGFALFMMVGSFVGGLVGWILTMKKTVLLCGNCRGVHAEAI